MLPSVYILANPRRTTLYVGVTSSLEQRVGEHRVGFHEDSFTDRYNVTRLVYCEECPSMDEAIAREKQLKRWSRAKKVALIESMNPEWRDLYSE